MDFVGESVVSWWSNVDGFVDRYGAKLRLIRKFVIRTLRREGMFVVGSFLDLFRGTARFVRDPIIFWITS